MALAGSSRATGEPVTEGRRGGAVWIATSLGIGFLPIAPGTLGSALGLALVAVLGRLPISRLSMTASLAVASALLFFLGAWASGEAEKFLGRHDPGPVVIDEVMGQMIAFLAKPDSSWKLLLAGFVLFRILDVVKPFPAGRAEKAPGGWGIMLDDVVAGAYSMAVLWPLGLVLG